MILVEFLQCEECFTTWERVVVRGRKPRICDDCRRYGIKPVTIPRRRITAADVLDPNSILIYTDGGRKDEGIGWENSDCTVRAIATATGVPYSKAHAFMAKAGRKRGKGANFSGAIYRAMRNEGHVFGCKFEEISYQDFKRSRGLKTALMRNPALRTGTWVLQQPRHVVTLKDGKLLDSFDSSRKEIRGAYKVVPIPAFKNTKH